MFGASCRGLSWSAPILSQAGSTNFGVCFIRRLSNQKSIASSRLRSRVSLTIEICDEVPALSRLPPRLYADIFTERGDFKRFPDCDRSRTQKRDLHLALTHCWSGRDSNCRFSLGRLTRGRGGFHARFRRCYSSGIHPVEPSHSEVCGCNISVPKRP